MILLDLYPKEVLNGITSMLCNSYSICVIDYQKRDIMLCVDIINHNTWRERLRSSTEIQIHHKNISHNLQNNEIVELKCRQNYHICLNFCCVASSHTLHLILLYIKSNMAFCLGRDMITIDQLYYPSKYGQILLLVLMCEWFKVPLS
jgi:hypothetical protein